ncbi:hypothetical protein Nepgr_006068 [Nepenthes gracilis]|uniref:Uncharacterized protein n=1 Tax=Nepenthes gracilis TaxID=150966 RepID=A0AAD3XGZ8_NEPGR|nr:hypothetical protein Nepgr_006068 [Nepenthes gracilis]
MVKGRQGERVRLYVRGSILGYKRSKSNQYPNTSLIQIEGVNTKEESPGLTVTAASFVLSSSLICLPNLWEIKLGCSCTPAISKSRLIQGRSYKEVFQRANLIRDCLSGATNSR